jgi:hypothetical protein
MASLTHQQYDALERAIMDGRRIALYRRGTEYVVIPHRLRVVDGHEQIESVHPTTGEGMVFEVEEVERLERIEY